MIFFRRLILAILLLTVSKPTDRVSAAEDIRDIVAGYQDGFYVKTSDDKFLFKIGSRFNFGYTYGFVTPQTDFSSFDLYHAKVYAGGNAWGPYVQYFFQAAAGTNTRPPSFGQPAESANGAFTLEDYYARLAKDGLYVKVGQFKTPFGRQWMTYSGNLQFVNRSAPTLFYQFGRDRGISFHTDRETLSLTAGVFNGGGSPGQSSGINPFRFSTNGQNVSNDTAGGGKGHLYIIRAVAMPFGSAGYSEGNVERLEGNRLDIGAGFAFDHDRDVDSNGDGALDDAAVNILAASGEVSWKSAMYALQSEFFYRKFDGSVLSTSESFGYYVQPSVFLRPGTLEVAGRFALVDPDTGTDDDRITEVAAALNLYFFSNHRYKTQIQYTWRAQETALGGQNDDHFIDMMLQLSM